MARQSTTPVAFGRTQRLDSTGIMSSGRAGVVVPVTYIPVLRGDSAAGSVGIDVELGEMPRPLLNGVQANFQAWFVPKSAHPQFSGYDEFMHSYQGHVIKQLGTADRTPPAFFNMANGSQVANCDIYKTLGLHVPATSSFKVNTDLLDAYGLIYNFRLAAHSSRLARRKYAAEAIGEAGSLARAFWPTSRLSRVVPDYERALIVGALDLDVIAGRLPISGIGTTTTAASVTSTLRQTKPQLNVTGKVFPSNHLAAVEDPANVGWPSIYAEMVGQNIGITLADIDKARTTQAFAKLRTAYAGNDATGFDNDDTIVAELMQGFRVPEEQFKRPWLLDSKRVGFGFAERHATDGANLDASVTQGRVSARLSINLPVQDVGGVIVVTLEVMPERLDERQSDEWLGITATASLPDALRDVQRTEPVDMVLNRRVDSKHTAPDGLYGYEPMNDVWNREFTRLGGAFYQATPGAPWTEQRSGLWLAEMINPTFTGEHYLAPANFPHDVFADTEAPAFEFVARHAVTIVGLTQIGDVLAENNDDYDAVEGA